MRFQPALIDVPKLLAEYFEIDPDFTLGKRRLRQHSASREFHRLFEMAAEAVGCKYRPEAVDYLLETHYRPANRALPSRRSRVTPGKSSTSASFWPTRRLNRVDLPTLGRPTMATLCGATRCGGSLSSAEGNESTRIGQDIDGAIGDDRSQPDWIAHVELAEDFAGIGRDRQ